jgi:membrane protein YdbS with pleckstrin-like domain
MDGMDVDGKTMPQQVNPMSVPQSPQTRHRSKTKPCPFCAETIRYEAIKCRFCGEFLSGDRRQAAGQPGNDGARNAASPGGDAQPPGAGQSAPGTRNGDDILWFGRPSAFALAWAFVKTTVFTLVCWAVYRYPVMLLAALVPKLDVSVRRLMQIEAWVDLAALGLGLAAVFSLFWRLLTLKSMYYEVTPDRIEWSRGIFDRQVDNLDMFRIIDLKLRRSLLECLLGIGTVVLTTKDDSHPHFEFTKVHQCRYLYDTLKEAGLNADKKRGVIHLE